MIKLIILKEMYLLDSTGLSPRRVLNQPGEYSCCRTNNPYGENLPCWLVIAGTKIGMVENVLKNHYYDSCRIFNT